MSKNIKDYLHLYLGCDFQWQWKEGDEVKQKVLDASLLQELHLHKPPYKQWLILRPLSDATPEEIKEIEDSRVFVKATPVHIIGNMQWTPETFRLALSKHFDLFGLIEAGLAIDKTTLNQQ